MKHLSIYISIIISLLFTNCAQITPLTGGKKDILPPKVLKTEPKNTSVNFTDKRITIYFDEYIVLKDITNQFIITPQTQELPDVEAHGKKVTIDFKETLLPNTTYKLFFGNAITDLKESNQLQNFEYIFSTGNSIDSLKLNGQILNYTDKKPVSNILVGLYPSNATDSIVYKQKPLYINKTNGNGEFVFTYLPSANFKLIGIKDDNKNLLYDGSNEQIAFSNTLVNGNLENTTLLYLFKEVPAKSFVTRTTHEEYGRASVFFNKPQLTITSVSAKGLIYYSFNTTNDSLTLYYNNLYDTLKPIITYNDKKPDSLLIKIPTRVGVKKLKEEQVIHYKLNTNIINSLPIYSKPIFYLNYPITAKNILQSNIVLKEKTETTQTEIPFSILTASTISESFTLQAVFKPDTDYSLLFKPLAFTGDSIRNNDSIIFYFKTTTADDYAKLNLKLFFSKKENYIVMLINDKEKITKQVSVSFSLASTSEKIIEFKNILPGNYFVRVVEDINKNGLFDTGNYFLHQQPESVFINDKVVKLLAGWDVDAEWIVK